MGGECRPGRTHPRRTVSCAGCGDGSLPIECFKGYVAQDAYFLEAFARAYAFCLANSRSREDLYGFAGLIAGVLQELKLHKGYAERWQVDLDGVAPIEATRAYVDFLLETARRGNLGETIAAMTPCMRLYAFLGRSLAANNVAKLYSEWVKTYADPGFEALAVQLEALLDLHAEDTRSRARQLPPRHGTRTRLLRRPRVSA